MDPTYVLSASDVRRFRYRHNNTEECKHGSIPIRPRPHGALPPLVLASPCKFARTDLHRLGGSGFAVPGDFWPGRHVSQGASSYTPYFYRAKGGSPASYSNLATLLATVKIYRSTCPVYPTLTPAWLTPKPANFIPAGGQITAGTHHVYIGIHTSTGYSPLHSAVNQCVFNISLSLLYTSDHRTWTAAVLNEVIEK